MLLNGFYIVFPFSRDPKRKRPDVVLASVFLVFVLSLWTFLEGPNDLAPPPLAEIAAPVEATSGKKITIPKDGVPIRFMMYNVRNYFMENEARRSNYEQEPKSEESIDALMQNIMQASPDVLGLCEMGGKLALADLQKRLKHAGLNLPYSVVLEHSREDRALALLSRYPLDNFSRVNVALLNEHQTMLRGILDVQLKHPDGRLFRVLGVHLKSKLSDNGAAASDSLRRREAMALRAHLDELMKQYHGLPVLLYGDFNDSPDSPSLKAIYGDTKSPYVMKRLKIKDKQECSWTIYYPPSDVYQAFDHILTNRALKSRLGGTYKAGIVDPINYKDASDHRALWIDLH